MADPVALPSFMQNSSIQGSNETEVSELTVAPNNSSFHPVVMTATPVANAPMTERNRLGSMGTLCGCEACMDEDETGLFILFRSPGAAGTAINAVPIVAVSITSSSRDS